MTVTAIAAGSRIMAAALAVAGAAFFGVSAIGQPLWFLSSGAPVDPGWAVHAWAGPLAGLPMAALAYFSLAIVFRKPSDQDEWEDLAAHSLQMGLCGLGLGALWAAVALGIALAVRGPSTVHLEGAEIVVPMIGALGGLALVVGVNLVRMSAGGVWAALGHIVWGFFGVAALSVGVPMLIDAAAIDDGRTLMQRFNLFVVFYPILWLAFAAMAVTVTICGVRWLRFGLSAHRPMTVAAPAPVDPWSTPDQDADLIVRRAA